MTASVCVCHRVEHERVTNHRVVLPKPGDDEDMNIQRVHFEADTTASLDVLWDTLQDYETWSTWGPWQRSELEQPGRDAPAGTGSIRRLTIGCRVLREETCAFEPKREMRYRVLEGIPVRDYEGVVLLEPVGSDVHITWKSSFHGKPAIVGPLVRRSLQAQFPAIVHAFADAAEARDNIRG